MRGKNTYTLFIYEQTRFFSTQIKKKNALYQYLHLQVNLLHSFSCFCTLYKLPLAISCRFAQLFEFQVERRDIRQLKRFITITSKITICQKPNYHNNIVVDLFDILVYLKGLDLKKQPQGIDYKKCIQTTCDHPHQTSFFSILEKHDWIFLVNKEAELLKIS